MTSIRVLAAAVLVAVTGCKPNASSINYAMTSDDRTQRFDGCLWDGDLKAAIFSFAEGEWKKDWTWQFTSGEENWFKVDGVEQPLGDDVRVYLATNEIGIVELKIDEAGRRAVDALVADYSSAAIAHVVETVIAPAARARGIDPPAWKPFKR